jgi:hypothetical protein
MKESLITLKTSKLAKKKGFQVDCENYWVETKEHTLDIPRNGEELFPAHKPRILGHRPSGSYHTVLGPAPTQSLLQKWLREAHNLYVDITKSGKGEFGSDIIYDVFYGWSITEIDSIKELCPGLHVGYKTYEEALEKGLFEALKLIKKQK